MIKLSNIISEIRILTPQELLINKIINMIREKNINAPNHTAIMKVLNKEHYRYNLDIEEFLKKYNSKQLGIIYKDLEKI